jgi:hypothetical protein
MAVNEWLAEATLEGDDPEQKLQLRKTPYLGAAGAGVFDRPDGLARAAIPMLSGIGSL